MGANVGLFSLAVLGHKHRAFVHIFEPSPVPGRLLRMNMDVNGLSDRVKLNPMALYSEPGEMDFCVHTGDMAALDGLRDTGYAIAGKTNVIKVPVSTLDLYTASLALNRMDLLKLDAEGAEYFILLGGRSTIRTLRPAVIFEVGRKNLAPYGITCDQIYAFFDSAGYCISTFSGDILDAPTFSERVDVDNEFLATPRL